MDKAIVIKLGGATLGSHDATLEDLVYLQGRGVGTVVIHGGAKVSTAWMKRLGIPTRFVDGERVTDKDSLEVVTAALAGLVNKEIVAVLNNMGGRAVGISGVDGHLIQARIRNEAMGYVGEVIEVDGTLLKALLGAGFIPVISPISLHAVDKPDEDPHLLNINGDPVAGEVAAALGADKLVFLTDIDGVRDREDKLIPRLSPEEARSLMDSGVISGGMIPKIKASLRAVSAGCVARIINGKVPQALRREVEGCGGGTTIEASGGL